MVQSRRETIIKTIAMEPGFSISSLADIHTSALYEIVDEVARSSTPLALNTQNLIINEVPEELKVKTDPYLISDIIGGILQILLTHSTKGYIRISAKNYTDIILVHIREFNVINNWQGGLFFSLQPLVKKIRGFLGVTSYRKNETTIAFTFPNLPIPDSNGGGIKLERGEQRD
jgi:hypothetical protein